MKKHLTAAKHCSRILSEIDVKICVMGYAGGDRKFLKEKESMGEFEGCNGFRFVNVQRND